MPAFVIYARKSSEAEDRQMLSVSAQVAELTALAKSRGLVIAHVFEESQSARRVGRPLFNQMMSLVDKKKVSGILCWKLDRLARNAVDGGRVIDAFDRGVLTEVFVPGRIFRNTADDKFMVGLEFGMSKKYVDDLSDNVRRGNRAVLQSGRVTATVPIGYLKEAPLDRLHARGAGRTVKDPVRFPLVTELFKRFLTGAYTVPKLHAFARDTLGLRTQGTRRFPPGPLSVSGLYTLLQNPFYAGFLTHAGEVYRGDHEPIVSKEDFDRIQALLRRADAPRPKTHDFVFRGLLRCGSCDRVVVGEEHWNRRYGIRYVYYRCGGRYVRGTSLCTEPYAREPEVERAIQATLERLEIPSPLLEWTLSELEVAATRVRLTEQAAILALEREREGKRRELERLLQLCTRGILSEGEYVNARMTVLADIERLTSEIEDPGRRQTAAHAELGKTLTLAASARSVFATGGTAERRELLGILAEKIVVASRETRMVLRRPYQLLIEALDEYRNGTQTGRDLNHAPNGAEVPQILDEVRFTPRAIPSRRRSRKKADWNHQIMPTSIEKTAGVDPAILSWWARILEVRRLLLQSRTENGEVSSAPCGQLERVPPPYREDSLSNTET